MTVIKDARGMPLFLERKQANIGWMSETVAAYEAADQAQRAENAVMAFKAAVDLGAGCTYAAIIIPADPQCARV